ncbi:MAG: PTS sugar transporter subunit IIA [Phycisphaerae bacterium]|nr:PTS sugar transporter subunit IIA [Phycisphaerae bacterium]
MKLVDFIKPELVFVFDSVESRDGLLSSVSDRLAETLGGIDATELNRLLVEREAQGDTATPEGLALPHAMSDRLQQTAVAVALVRGGVDFRSQRARRVDLVFTLVGPTDKGWEHIRLLARVARICHAPGALKNLRAAADGGELYQRLVEEDERHV